MSNFNFFGWTSLVLSKYLSPYFKNLENTNIDIGFWNGHLKFQKLELKKEFFLHFDIDLDVEGSMIEQVELIIPWKSLQTDPVKLRINGLKLCVAHHFNKEKGDKKKNDILLNVKRETLRKFDELIKKKSMDDDIPSGSFLYLVANNIINNAEIQISNVEFVYINHLGHTEIVKIGFKFDEFVITSGAPEKLVVHKEQELYASKKLELKSLAVYFDVYDDSFLKKMKDKKPDLINKELAVYHNYIINNFNIESNFYMHYAKKTSLHLDFKISPILLHFKQKQIGYLIVMIQKIDYHDKNRPRHEISSKSQASKWWKYLASKVMSAEKTQMKARQRSFITFVESQKYEKFYTKRLLNEKSLAEFESKFLKKFEAEQHIGIIIVIREKALAAVREKLKKLKDADHDEGGLLEKWFRKFDKTFKNELANVHISLMDQPKNTKANLSFKLELNVASIGIILRDNDVIDALKDLQKHYIYYNDALDNQLELKQKVIDHIKHNFLKLLATDSMNISGGDSSAFYAEANDLSAGNFDPKATLADYIKLIENRKETDPPPKLLLSCTFEDISTVLRSEDKQLVVQFSLQKVHCIDLLGVNNTVKDVVLFKDALKVIYSSNAIQKREREIVSMKIDRVAHEDINYINEVMIDVETSKIDIFLTKPFAGRLLSVVEFLNFRLSKTASSIQQEKNDQLNKTKQTQQQEEFTRLKLQEEYAQNQPPEDYDRHQQFYGDILRRKKINLFLPTDYEKDDWMLVVHVNSIKFLKREYENGNRTEKLNDLVEIADEQKEFVENSFQPSVCSVEGLRMLITRDTDWEAKENPFLYKAQPRASDTLQSSHRSELDGSSMHHILEIFRFELFVEQMTTPVNLINGAHSAGLPHRPSLPHRQDLVVFPKQTRTSIDLPLIIVNLSIPTVYILMSLAKIWTTSEKSMGISDFQNTQHKHNYESQTEVQTARGNISKVNDPSVRKKRPFRGLIYPSSVRSLLEETILQHIEVHLQGLILNLGIGGEAYHSSFRNNFNNSFMTVYARELHIEGQSKYFESKLKVRLQDLLVEDMMAEAGIELDLFKITREAFETLRKEEPLLTSQSRNYERTQNPESTKSNRNVRETKIEEEEEKEPAGKSSPYERVGVRFDETSKNEKANPNDQSEIYEDNVELLLSQKLNSEPVGQFIKPKGSKKVDAENKTKSHLMMNFIGADEETNCFIMKVHTIKQEYNRYVNSSCLNNNITIKLAAFVFVANPKIFSNIQWIIHYGSLFAEERFKNFELFMKNEAFWPEINMELNASEMIPVLSTSSKEDKGLIVTKLKLEIPYVNLIMMHKDNPLYFVNLTTINLIYTGNPKSSDLRVTASDLTLKNVSRAAGLYQNIAMKIDGEKDRECKQDALMLEVRNLDEDEAQFRGYSTEISVKLNEMDLLFLNRVVNEIVTYLRQYLLKSLQGHESDFVGKPNPSEETKSPEPRSDTKFSLLILKSVVKLPRNSATDEYIIAKIEKMGLWSTGKWGEHCGKLIETGFFDFEKEKDDKDEHEFKDVYEDEQEMKQSSPDKKGLDSKNHSERAEGLSSKHTKEKKHIPENDELKVLVEGVQFMVRFEHLDCSQFASLAEKRSVEVRINIGDKKFSLPPFEVPEPPIKVDVIIPSLKLFAYEPDYNLIMHFFMDNLGEKETVVEPNEPLDPYGDEGLWCVVHLRVKKGLIKVFSNTRADLYDHISNKLGETPQSKDFIMKNDAALALIEVYNIFYRLCLKKGGGNVMLLDIEKFDLYDFRNNSRLGADLKKVISSNVFKNLKGRLEEGDSTLAKADIFQEQDSEIDDTEFDLDSNDGEIMNENQDAKHGDKAHKKHKAHKLDDDSKEKKQKSKKEREKKKKKRLQKKFMEERHKELEKKKKKVEEQQKELGATRADPSKAGFLRKLIRCYWCRKQAIKEKKTEKNYKKQPGDIRLQIELPENNRNPQQERDLWIPFQPDKDGANVLFSPQDPELKELFHDHSPPKGNNQIDLDEELEIPMNKQAAEVQRATKQPLKQTEQQQQPVDKQEKKGVYNTHQNSPILRTGSHGHKNHKHSHHRHPNRHRRQTPKSTGSQITWKETKTVTSAVYAPDFIITKYDDCIQMLLKDRNSEKFMLSHEENDSELFLFMESGYNGEKSIHVKLQNKTIILAPDLIQDLVAYFIKPFNQSEIVRYWRELNFNNFAPMNVKVSLSNASVLLLEDYTTLVQGEQLDNYMAFRNKEPDPNERKNCALVTLNTEFSYSTQGDATAGPGSVSMNTEVSLRRVNIIKAATIFDGKEEFKSSGLQQSDRTDSSQISLVQPFKIVYKTHYQLNKHREGLLKNYPAEYGVKLKILNGKDITRNFLFTVDHIKVLQKIIKNVQAPSTDGTHYFIPKNKEKTAASQLNQDILNSSYTIRFPSIKLAIFNKMQVKDLLRITISKFLLKRKDYSNNRSKMKARSTLEVESFNRRKVNYEPLLEPWQFMCTRISKDSSNTFTIENAKNPDFKENERIENQLYHNSLNINLSSECIETLLGISKLLSGDMREDHPYCIINRTHKSIKIKTSKKTRARSQITKTGFRWFGHSLPNQRN